MQHQTRHPRPRRAAAPAAASRVETLEDRVHRSFTLTTNPYVTEISGYSLFADICYGDNGDPWGQEEMGMGAGPGVYLSSNLEWDDDLSDGLDSGPRQVYFRADAGDNLGVLWVDGGEMLAGAYNLDSIGGVMLRVAVMQPQMSMTWESASIGFFNNGRLVRSEGLGSIQASTFGGGWEAETIVQVDMPHAVLPVSEIARVLREGRHNGRRNHPVQPTRHFAVGVDRRLDPVDRRRVVEPVPDVVLAGPLHPDGRADLP